MARPAGVPGKQGNQQANHQQAFHQQGHQQGHQQQQPAAFDNEKLRYLSMKLKEFTKSERINDVLRIVKENETVDQQSGGISLNVKKMKDVTIEKLFHFVNSNKI